MNSTPTSTFLEWLIGISVGILGFIGAGFGDVYRQHNRLQVRLENLVETKTAETRNHAAQGDERIWRAHNDHVNKVSDFREKIAQQIGDLAKRSDIDNLRKELADRDSRLLTALQNGNSNHNNH